MTTTHYLDRNDVKALRSATTLCFDHSKDHGTGIRAIHRKGEGAAYYDNETVHKVPVGDSRINNYSRERYPSSGSGVDQEYTCFAYIGSAMFDANVQTFVKACKVGRSLGFRWVRDNSSPVTTEAGIVVDHLDVLIFDANGSAEFCSRMSTFIGLDNSARMVKYA